MGKEAGFCNSISIDAGLPAPEFIETPNTVKLILRNNVDKRTAHRNKASNGGLNDGLNMDEILLLNILRKSSDITQKELAKKWAFH